MLNQSTTLADRKVSPDMSKFVQKKLQKSWVTHFLWHIMSGSRKWIKSTPSPVALRDQIYRNCLSEVKAKRSGMVQQLRQISPQARTALMKSFVNEVYNATRLENSAFNDSTNEMEYDGVDQNEQEMLNQIADAIEFELERQEQLQNEIQLLEMEELEELSRVDMYEEDENCIICPLCRNSTLVVSETTGTASCLCGVLINLQSTPGLQSRESSQSQEFTDAPSEIISAKMLRARLANAYERHMLGTSSQQLFPLNHADDVPCRNNGLEFQITEGHLCAFCTHCSFYEQIT